MKIKCGTTSVTSTLILYVAVLLTSCQLLFAHPQHVKRHHHGHGHGWQHKQEQPHPCVTHHSGEQYRNHEALPCPSPDFNGEPDPNFQGPDNGPGPGISILPKEAKVPQDSNFEPSSSEGSGGLQILIPAVKEQESGLKPHAPEPLQPNICSDGAGIYRKTGTCYKFATKIPAGEELSPCGPFMEFYKSINNPLYGECDCKVQHLGVSRPIAYWKKSDQCYWLFDQGPCKHNEWLVLNDNDVVQCQQRSCPENTPEDWTPVGGNTKYWFRHRGKCLKSGSTGFCEDVEDNIYFELNKENRFDTECKKNTKIEVKTLLNGAKPLPCLPGHKESATGECRKTAAVEF